MNPTLNLLFFKKLTLLQLKWHDIVLEKRSLEDQIARYQDAAVLVRNGEDPCYALLMGDCHFENRAKALSNPGEVVRLHEELKRLQVELENARDD